MKVIINKPAPVVQPPPTYDLIGLTEKQAELIYRLLGKVSCTDAAKLIGEKDGSETCYELYKQLADLGANLPLSPMVPGVLRLGQ